MYTVLTCREQVTDLGGAPKLERLMLKAIGVSRMAY